MREVRGRGPSGVGKELERARKGLGWSLRRAEEESKVSNGYISQVERGEAEPSPEVLRKLGQAYGVPFPVLMEAAGYIAKRYEPKDSGKVPAFVFSAAEKFDDRDWDATQAFFQHLLKSKGEGGAPS
ncbi:MAG: helix-turn-helix domain-containing protein [Actinomycetota bacterium]|nr:helix-turn-helix domain-containing protein [Actinomycetota bacterium]